MQPKMALHHVPYKCQPVITNLLPQKDTNLINKRQIYAWIYINLKGSMDNASSHYLQIRPWPSAPLSGNLNQLSNSLQHLTIRTQLYRIIETCFILMIQSEQKIEHRKSKGIVLVPAKSKDRTYRLEKGKIQVAQRKKVFKRLNKPHIIQFC